MGSSMGCVGICSTMVFTMACRGISAPVSGAPPASPALLTLAFTLTLFRAQPCPAVVGTSWNWLGLPWAMGSALPCGGIQFYPAVSSWGCPTSPQRAPTAELLEPTLNIKLNKQLKLLVRSPRNNNSNTSIYSFSVDVHQLISIPMSFKLN